MVYMMARMRWTMINAMICIMMHHKVATIKKEIISIAWFGEEGKCQSTIGN